MSDNTNTIQPAPAADNALSLAGHDRVARVTARPLGCLPALGDRLMDLRRHAARKPKLTAARAAALTRELGESVSAAAALTAGAMAEIGVRRASVIGTQAYVVTEAGVLLTWVVGPTDNLEADVHDSQGSKFGTAYTSLTAVLLQAIEDDDVRAVVLAIDSPGGAVLGLRSTREAMLAVQAAGKLVATVAMGHAASCGCWLHSAASPGAALTTPGAVIGYLGVYQVLFDRTGEAEKAGIKVEYIHSNAAKLDGAEYMPVSDEARARLTNGVLALNNESLADVAASRAHTGMTIESLAAFAGSEVYAHGARAIDVGLADAVVSGVLAAVRFAESRATSDQPLVASVEAPGQTRPEESGNRQGCRTGLGVEETRKATTGQRDTTMTLTRDALKNLNGGPAMIDLLLAEGRASAADAATAESAKPADFAALKAAGLSNDGIVDALDRKLSITAATSERAASEAKDALAVRERVVALTAENTRLKAQLADRAASIQSLAEAGISPGRASGVSDVAPASASKLAKPGRHPFMLAVDDEMASSKCSLPDAIRTMAQRQPELHAAMKTSRVEA